MKLNNMDTQIVVMVHKSQLFHQHSAIDKTHALRHVTARVSLTCCSPTVR